MAKFTQMDTMIRVKIDGTSHDLKFHSLKVEQELFHHCEIQLEIGVGLKREGSVEDVFKSAEDWLGGILEAEMYDNIRSTVSKKYKGVITQIDANDLSMVLTAVSEDHILSSAKKYYSWSDTDITSIVKDIVSRAGLKDVNISAKKDSQKLSFFQQYNETDYDCLKRLAKLDGCVFFHDGENFIYGRNAGVTGGVTLRDEEIKDLSVNYKLKNSNYRGMPYDPTKHTKIKDSEAKSAPIKPPDNKMTKMVKDKSDKVFKDVVEDRFVEALKDKKSFEIYMKERQANIAGDMMRIKGETSNPAVSIGKKIECKDDPLIGKSVTVIKMKAEFEDNVYTSKFECMAAGATIKPKISSLMMLAQKLQPAEVVNNEDPDDSGKVQVQYLWDTEGASLAWARVSQAGAGGTSGDGAHGTHFTPRVGDQVLIACEKGDPSKPIVIGALYHSESKPYFNGPVKEEYLVVRSPKQSMIRILDEQGKEELCIDMGGGATSINLGLHGKNDAPQIALSAGGGTIIVKAKDIIIEAEEKFQVKAKDIEMEAEKTGKMKTGTEYTLEAGTKATEKVGTDKKLTAGSKMELSSTGPATLKSTAKCEVTAATVAVKGSAMTEIKGGLVKIN